MNILDAMDHPDLFGPVFGDRAKWGAWRAFLAVLFGLPFDDDDARRLAVESTGRDDFPEGGFSEAWLPVGRRGGKSQVLALVAVFLAVFKGWITYLSPGERATVQVIAADRKQARVIMRYISGLLEIPTLAPMVDSLGAEKIDLNNRVTIEVHSASFRTVRGYAIAAALCDEIAFWRSDDSASPDKEIVAAIRPAMATLPGAMLLGASSPYARRGVLFDAYKRHHAKADAPVLVWQAASKTMNPTLPDRVIAKAYEEDPEMAAAEYGANFRTDVVAFLPHEAVEACVEPGCFERPYSAAFTYVAFADPSGGSQDAMTLAIAHAEGPRRVLDLVREVRPPFSPDAVVKDFAAVLKSYGLGRVYGDRYGGEWPAERFRAHGITYTAADRAKSDLYKDALPLLTTGRADLIDSARLVNELASLERRTTRGGRDSIDHGPGGHDDVANAVAGALVYALDANPDALISGDVALRARAQIPGLQTAVSPLVFGINVSPDGDGLVWVIDRRGRTAGTVVREKLHGFDSNEIADAIAALVEQHNPDGLIVGGTGDAGALFQALKARNFGAVVHFVLFGTPALHGAHFANRRAEMWSKMAEWLRDANTPTIPNDDELQAALCGVIRHHDAQSRVAVSDQNAHEADALALTFARTITRAALRQKAPIRQNFKYSPLHWRTG